MIVWDTHNSQMVRTSSGFNEKDKVYRMPFEKIHTLISATRKKESEQVLVFRQYQCIMGNLANVNNSTDVNPRSVGRLL